MSLVFEVTSAESGNKWIVPINRVYTTTKADDGGAIIYAEDGELLVHTKEDYDVVMKLINASMTDEQMAKIVATKMTADPETRQAIVDAMLYMKTYKEKQISETISKRTISHAGACASVESALFNELNELHNELFGSYVINTIPN